MGVRVIVVAATVSRLWIVLMALFVVMRAVGAGVIAPPAPIAALLVSIIRVVVFGGAQEGTTVCWELLRDVKHVATPFGVTSWLQPFQVYLVFSGCGAELVKGPFSLGLCLCRASDCGLLPIHSFSASALGSTAPKGSASIAAALPINAKKVPFGVRRSCGLP